MTSFKTIETGGATRASLYFDAPSWDGRRTACFGAFACASIEDGAHLLEMMAEQTKKEGFDALIGPMDGDSWHSYRAVTWSDGSAPFLMEPVSGPHDVQALEQAGFAPIESYLSARADLRVATKRKPARIRGITISSWDGENAAAHLGGLFDMSAHAFAGNRLFKPIDKAAFLALYEPLMPLIDPRYVLFAHNSRGEVVGFLFAIPDHAQGAAPRSIIIKTYASLRPGVGHLLGDHLHRLALANGFTHVIHALMHETNTSLKQSRKYGAEICRRYALMGRELGQELT